MLIGELADALELPTQTVRFYERRGLLPEPHRAPNGYRIYDQAALGRLQFIRGAQTAGLTLAEIRSIIDIRDRGTAPCTHVDALLDAKLHEVRDRLRQLVALESDLEQIVERSRRLDPADCAEGDVCQILQTETSKR
jgi:DNA-binding transcriptional MerR regulator